MPKSNSSTPAKRTSARKASGRVPATPKAKKRASAPAEASYEVLGKGKGAALPVLTETDVEDLADADPAQ